MVVCVCIIVCLNRFSKSVADPGFSPGGVHQLPKLIFFFKFLLKTA